MSSQQNGSVPFLVGLLVVLASQRMCVSELTRMPSAPVKSEVGNRALSDPAKLLPRRWQTEAIEKALQARDTVTGVRFLVEVAKRRQAAKGVRSPTVLFAITDEESADALLQLFIESLSRVSPVLAATFVVVAFSKGGFEACRELPLLCLFDSESSKRFDSLAADQSTAALPRNKHPLFLEVGWHRLKLLREALKSNATMMSVDLDIVWLRNPLPLLEHSAADFQLTSDGGGPNTGLLYVRPSPCSSAFLSGWLKRRERPESREQYEFAAAVVDVKKTACPDFKVEYLDKALFPNGCCCGKQLPDSWADSQKWAMWHAACSGDVFSKRRTLWRIARAHQKQSRPHA